MQSEKRTLLILAGGRGARFGGDKGLSKFEGIPMVKLVVDALKPLADRVVVAVAPGKAKDYSNVLGSTAVVVEDKKAHEGPLLGLKDALERTSDDILILSACDMPYMRADLYRMLLGKLGKRDAAMPSIGGYEEPIMGVYRLSALRRAIELATSGGEVKLSTILTHLDYLSVPEEEMRQAGLDPEIFTNLNRPKG